MKKDLKYFMRENKEETVFVEAPESFKDEEGKPIVMEIKVLSPQRIDEIQEKYKKRTIATDKKGNPIISNDNEIVWKTTKDSTKALRHTIVEALVYPPLNSKELMEYYKCVDITEMPVLVFSKKDELRDVTKKVLATLGVGEYEDEESDYQEAKNA